MSINYDKLFRVLQAQEKTEYYLRKHGISPSILNKIKHKTGGLDHRTIDKLCALLNCQPGDLMEYIPDPENPDNTGN